MGVLESGLAEEAAEQGSDDDAKAPGEGQRARALGLIRLVGDLPQVTLRNAKVSVCQAVHHARHNSHGQRRAQPEHHGRHRAAAQPRQQNGLAPEPASGCHGRAWQGGVVQLYSFGSLGEVVGGWRRRASPVACKTPNQTARELREEEAGGY